MCQFVGEKEYFILPGEEWSIAAQVVLLGIREKGSPIHKEARRAGGSYLENHFFITSAPLRLWQSHELAKCFRRSKICSVAD